MSRPGVILTKTFVSSKTTKIQKQYKDYVNYIDREEATLKERFMNYSSYNNYMDNPNKKGGLFTNNKDFLTDKEKSELKKRFLIAQQNNSILWQDVVSFDNEFLEKHGLYDSKTNVLDEKKLMEATRSMMRIPEEREKLSNMLWSASFHYNTDNIHIHIAYVEMTPNIKRRKKGEEESRGKFKLQTVEKMKSNFVNVMLDRQKGLNKINNIIRKDIINERPNDLFYKDINMKKLMVNIYKSLPKDKKQWHYNYNTVDKKKIDLLSDYYIEYYKTDEFKLLKQELKKEELLLKEIYGEGIQQQYKNYYKTKIDDLYTRMGNSFIKEIKEIMKEKENNRNNKRNTQFKRSIIDNNIRTNMDTVNKDNVQKNLSSKQGYFISRKDINAIKRVFNKDFESIKNQQEYEKLNREIEKDRQMSEYER